MNNRVRFLFAIILCTVKVNAFYVEDKNSYEAVSDTVNYPGVEVVDSLNSGSGLRRLDDVQTGSIYAAKKTELIRIRDLTINTSTNNARQAFASVAGLNIWESDGAGLQLSIGGRGLSPNRTSNFNTRQNGYDISADPLGYPEAYYTPPLDIVERIELVRGAGSLRYGTQFGGTLNFVLRKGDNTTPIAVRSRLGGGSYGFATGFAELGGTAYQTNYIASYQFKRADGWRPNSQFEMHTANASATYTITPLWWVKADYTYMSYLAQQPGGLTDNQFYKDPTVSVRARNWFNVIWNVASIQLDGILSDRTAIRSLTFGNLSQRQSVGDLSRINQADLGGARTLIDGQFYYFGNETTITTDFDFLSDTSVLVTGVRYFRGETRQRQGDGSAGSDANFKFTNPNNLEGSDYTFPNDDAALFAEAVIPIANDWRLVPGIRAEYITTRADGWYRRRIKDLAGNIVLDSVIDEQRSRSRVVALAGIGISWKPNEGLELYGNATQNYRSITFSDLRVTNPNLVIDPNISDERGYTLDLGTRGTLFGSVSFDASIFYLRYSDRIGEVLRVGGPPYYLPYTYRTNIGDAYTSGIEAVVDLNISQVFELSESLPTIHWLINGSAMRSQYLESEAASVEGNAVEFVPAYIIRTSLSAQWSRVRCSISTSWVGEHYTDASNAVYTASAVTGSIPAYSVTDLSISYSASWFSIEGSLNNILNAYYFTRRASSYPGPGIIPAEPRTITVIAQFQF
ncbi:MAG: TonB-dependent receptor [Ignavibacteria bacterium]|nr:TonB-dependent receptor [Ignavibacteria bacterium]